MRSPVELSRIWKLALVASALRNLGLGVWSSISPDAFSRLYRRIRPYTMVSPARLRGLYDAIRYVDRQEIPGDVVECGMARGGSAALMGLALSQNGSARRIWGFDSFEGMPEPTAGDPDYEIARKYVGTCRGDADEVRRLLERLGLASRAMIVPGLFEDSLPRARIGQIAVLHVDADWYESVLCCLEHLYPRLAPGGVLQIDDYGYWEGARKAVDEYFARLSDPPVLRVVDYEGRQAFKARPATQTAPPS